MNNNPKVSIIIPVYNVEQYLRQCLDSVVNQTFKDIEIIVINDGSTDNSLQIIREFQLKDNRIILIDLKQNSGLANARKKGIVTSKCKYITFVDSDDWVTKDYIEILYSSIEKFNSDFAGSEFYFYNNITKQIEDGIPYCTIYDKPVSNENDKKVSFYKLFIGRVWATIYRKDFLLSNDITFRLDRFEDLLFTYETIIKSSCFSFVKNKLYYYRIGRKFSNVSTNTIYDKLALYKQIKLLTDLKEFKNYIPDTFTFICKDIAVCLENSKLSFGDLTKIFFDFKNLFHNKDYKLNYKHVNFRNKIRLFVFDFCMKHNLNYIIIGKIHNKFNPIRLLKINEQI